MSNKTKHIKPRGILHGVYWLSFVLMMAHPHLRHQISVWSIIYLTSPYILIFIQENSHGIVFHSVISPLFWSNQLSHCSLCRKINQNHNSLSVKFQVQVPRGPTLRWRHNERDGVSNYQLNDCLLKRLFRHRSKETSLLRVTGLCVGNSPVTSEFPAQRASNAENVSIWWRHHEFGRHGARRIHGDV